MDIDLYFAEPGPSDATKVTQNTAVRCTAQNAQDNTYHQCETRAGQAQCIQSSQ